MATATKSVEISDDQLQLIAKALADPRRYEILKKISTCCCPTKGFVPCSQMRDAFDISPATLSHHMKELETAGLVRSEKTASSSITPPSPKSSEPTSTASSPTSPEISLDKSVI